ncbi:MAG: PKD domain-containing protein [bacterium]|nr:PKD domain-containing protein [bacterium]
MTFHPGTERGRNHTLLLLTALLFLHLVGSPPLLAQLKSDDIASLQARAAEEGWTFTVGQNPACEYSMEQLCGFKEPDNWRDLAPTATLETELALPSRFDWRDEVDLTPVKNQGGCGSCWAFATVGVLEQVVKIKDGLTKDFSEQWLVSCNQNGWNCVDGGFAAHDYHDWKSDACGIGPVYESEFPYMETDWPCSCPYTYLPEFRIESWAYSGSTVQQIKQAIMDYGPVYVSVRATDPMQGYTGGIFNNNEAGPTNHAVVLVGWDDDQGLDGVWFMRNSWGTWWGEDDGYCRIEYGCCAIGSNANYVVYWKIRLEATPTFGPAPLSVDFNAVTSKTVSDWDWDFGDGQAGVVQSPTHEYTQPGYHTVELTIQTPEGPVTETVDGMVSVYADTLTIEETPLVGSISKVDVYAQNYLPLGELSFAITWSGPLHIRFDSVSTVGLRTSYFENITIPAYDAGGQRAAVRMQASTDDSQPYLAPGSDPIASLYFTDSGSTSGTNPIAFGSIGPYSRNFITYGGEYQPEGVDGSLFMGCCQPPTVGDVDQSGVVDITDVSVLIDNQFLSLSPISCEAEGDVDFSGVVDITDLSVLIDNQFLSLAPLPPCP